MPQQDTPALPDRPDAVDTYSFPRVDKIASYISKLTG